MKTVVIPQHVISHKNMTNKQKYYLFAGITIISVIIIAILSSKTKIANNITPTNTSPILPETITSNGSDKFILKNDVSEIDWSEYSNNLMESSVKSYSFEPTSFDILSSQIASALNFNESQLKVTSSGNKIWSTTDRDLMYTKDNNVIEINNYLPQTKNTGFQEDKLIQTASSELVKILPSTQFTFSNVNYFLKDNNIPVPGNVQNSKLAEVNYNQQIDGLNIIPQSLSNPSSVSIIINSDLKVRSVKIRYLISNSLASKDKINISPSNIKNIIPREIHRLTPYSLDLENQLSSISKPKFFIQKINIALLARQNKLEPVFILTGRVEFENQKIDNTVFVAPIPTP